VWPYPARRAGRRQLVIGAVDVGAAAYDPPKDLPYGDAPLAVRWRKVQWQCRGAGVPAKGVHRFGADRVCAMQMKNAPPSKAAGGIRAVRSVCQSRPQGGVAAVGGAISGCPYSRTRGSQLCEPNASWRTT
jgi:hypothetical protein